MPKAGWMPLTRSSNSSACGCIWTPGPTANSDVTSPGNASSKFKVHLFRQNSCNGGWFLSKNSAGDISGCRQPGSQPPSSVVPSSPPRLSTFRSDARDSDHAREAKEAVAAFERECAVLKAALTEYQAATSPMQSDQ